MLGEILIFGLTTDAVQTYIPLIALITVVIGVASLHHAQKANFSSVWIEIDRRLQADEKDKKVRTGRTVMSALDQFAEGKNNAWELIDAQDL